METEGLKPSLRPEIQFAKFLNDFAREVFLGGGSKPADDRLRSCLEIVADKTEGSNNKGVAGGLPDMIAACVPVVNDVKFVPLGVTEKLIKIVDDKDVQVEKKDTLST